MAHAQRNRHRSTRGEAVKAVADGYVKEIKEDPCYGITIVIDHENGYKSVYSNLASASMVSVNQRSRPVMQYQVWETQRCLNAPILLTCILNV